MVFRWFSKFWGQWSTMVLRLTIVWMSHCKKCAKSIYDKTHILSRTCKWTSIESIWYIIYGPYMDHIYSLLTSLHSMKFTQYNRESVSNVRWFRRRRGYHIKACKMISRMRQVSFATAMRSNKYQGRLTQTLLQKSQIKIVIVTTGLFHSFKRMLIWEDHWQVQWF